MIHTKNMEKAINTCAHPHPEKGSVRRQGVSKGPEAAASVLRRPGHREDQERSAGR